MVGCGCRSCCPGEMLVVTYKQHWRSASTYLTVRAAAVDGVWCVAV